MQANSAQQKVKVFCFLVCIIGYSHALAVVPANNARLHHTQVMLEYPYIPGVSKYDIRVFERITNTLRYAAADGSVAHLVNEGLEFGKEYAWQVTAINNKGSVINRSDTFYFSINTHPLLQHLRFTIPTYVLNKVNNLRKQKCQ